MFFLSGAYESVSWGGGLRWSQLGWVQLRRTKYGHVRLFNTMSACEATHQVPEVDGHVDPNYLIL